MENFITEITKQLNNGHAQQAQYSVSEDGSTLIYGYPDKECALIFTKQDSEWVFQQKLTVSGGVTSDWFGGSVALSSNGSTVLIGADGDSSYRGAVYIFTRSGVTWIQQAKLMASDGAAGDDFGASVTISSDGSTTIVGAYNKSSNTGAAYVFTRSGSTWTQQQKLVASDGAAGDYFGFSVSISSDGSTAIVGAWGKSTNTGAAYVFTRSGSTWTQQQKLTVSDVAAYDWLGCRCILPTNGTLVRIFTWYNNEYTFTLLNGTWTETSKQKED